LNESQILSEAYVVRGSGKFTGPIFVHRSPTAIKEITRPQNRSWVDEAVRQTNELKNFDGKNPNGYIIVTDTIENHMELLREDLQNLKALVSVNFASKFSHPIKIVSEMGIFYLGILGKKDLLDTLITGDTLSVASDQSRGIIYDLVKQPIELQKRDLSAIEIVKYENAINKRLPSWEEVDDKLFVDFEGKFGVFIWDYNEESGIPTDVFYDLIRLDGGYVIGRGDYAASESRRPYTTFPPLLDSLLKEAREKSKFLSNRETE
jgi:hypothetical protein